MSGPKRAERTVAETTVFVVRFLFRYAKKYWVSYLFGVLALIATNLATVRIAALMGEIINEVERVTEASGSAAAARELSLTQAIADPVLELAIQLMILAGALVVVRTLSRVLFFNPGRDIQYLIGVDLFAHLLTLQRPFYSQRKVGELVSVAANDLQSIRLLVGFAGLQVLNVAVALPIHLWQMARLDWQLTLWCMTPILIGAIYMRWTVSRFYSLVRESLEKLGALSDRILESFAGVGSIRAHAADEAAVARFQGYNRAYFDLQLEIARLRAFAMPVLGLAGFLGAGLVFWVGGERVLDGELEVGDLITFTTLLTSLVPLLASLAWVLTAISRGTVALERVDDVLSEEPGLPPVELELRLDQPPALELRGLSFTHPGRDAPALRDVSARVEPGQTLGIFGRTGSGKTTLIDLLARVYTPPPGTVFVDGHDARGLELAALREGMSVVPQSPFLFSATLRDNVRMLGERSGHFDSDDAEFAGPKFFRRRWARASRRPQTALDAPRQAELDPRLRSVLDAACLEPDLASLPEGLSTIVGERGVMLSGGQRQRTALARALYRGPKLLLLDDILSAVDQNTETKLVAAIRNLDDQLGEGTRPTTVIVSHRTSVLEHADEILVLDDGEVVERGTHAELITAGGAYAAAHEHQREETQPHG